MSDQTEFDNRELLAQMSRAAKAGTPGMETHPDYVRRTDDSEQSDGLHEARRNNWRASDDWGPEDHS